jgi:hypothetical protein
MNIEAFENMVNRKMNSLLQDLSFAVDNVKTKELQLQELEKRTGEKRKALDKKEEAVQEENIDK